MANYDAGFGSSEMMNPAIAGTGQAPQAMVPAAPFAVPATPAFGGAMPGGPEILQGPFNQTWLMNCLRRRWVLALLLGMLLSAATAALLLWLFPLSSSVAALVHIQKEQTVLMGDKARPISPKELEIFQDTQLSLIKSQFVLQSALTRPNIAQLNAVVKEEPDPVVWLQEELQVGFYGEMLSVRYDGEEDSEEMKKVVDAVIAAYEGEVLGKKRMQDAEMQKNLAELHQDLFDELRGKIDKYQTLSKELDGGQSPIASTVLNMLINEVRQIQMQIIKKKEMLIEIGVTKTLAETQARSKTALEQAVREELDNDPMIANYKTDQFGYQQQIRMLRIHSRQGTSPEIKRMERTLAQLQQESDSYRATREAELRKSFKMAPNDFLAQVLTEYVLRRDSLTRDIAELNAEYEDKIAQIKQKGELNGELAMLESEIEQLKEIEGTMDYKLRSWDVQKSASSELFRVMQDATASERINEIQRYTLAGLGGLGAFCATCYGIALIEFRRRRLNGASDIDEGLGVRVLGVLPSVSSKKAMAPGSIIAAQLSESIDNVRATLMHDSTTQKRQVVLITSPATMEGSTTVASHLALSLTRAGRRTLLIDGDIREPSLHKLFGMPLDDGLCEVLRTDLDVSDAVRPTNTEGLWLLTAGHCDMESIHALATDQPQPIFEKLRADFDFIIVDGAPILGLSDSLSLGQHVDGAILTVLRDHSEVRKVYQAVELLKSMGIRLLGSVVNGVPLKADRRIVKLHKTAAKGPRKLAAAAAVKVDAKVDEVDEATNSNVDLDLDDLGIDFNE